MKSITSNFSHPEEMIELLIHDLSLLGNRAWNLNRRAIHFFSDADERYRSSLDVRTAIAARRLVAELNEGSYSNNLEQKERNHEFLQEQFPRQRTDRLIACLQRESVIALIDEKSEVATLLAHFLRNIPKKILDLPPTALIKLYTAPLKFSETEIDEKAFRSLQAGLSVNSTQLLNLFLQDLREIVTQCLNSTSLNLDTYAIRNFIAARILLCELSASRSLCENSLILCLHSESLLYFIDENSQVANLLANFMCHVPDKMIDLPAEVFKKLYPAQPKLRPVKQDPKEEKTEVAPPMLTIIKEAKPIIDETPDTIKFEQLLAEFDSECDKTADMIKLLKENSPQQLEKRIQKLLAFYSGFSTQIKTQYSQYKHHIVFLEKLFDEVLLANRYLELFSSTTIISMMDFFNDMLLIPSTFNMGAFALAHIVSETYNKHENNARIIESFLNLNLLFSPEDPDTNKLKSINRIIHSTYLISSSHSINSSIKEKIIHKLYELMSHNLNHVDKYYKKDSKSAYDTDTLTRYYYENFSSICLTLAKITCYGPEDSRNKFNEYISELTKNYHFFLVKSALIWAKLNAHEATTLASIIRNKDMNDEDRNEALSSLAKIIQKEVSSQHQNTKLNLRKGEEKTFPDDKSDDVARIIWSYVTSEPLPVELRRR
ncbi:MAG: hypothetical protein ACYCQI_00190 [Gammaproteobacteria bacterium]